MNWLPEFSIKPHQLSPLLAGPRTLSLIFVGAAGYLGYIDPSVRNSLPKIRDQLTHWTEMYKPSIKVLGSFATIIPVLSVAAYFQTKVSLWLVGGGLMVGSWVYTLLVLMPINNYLLKVDSENDRKKQMTSSEKFTVKEKISQWVKAHRVRVFISLIAASVFYWAELKSTQKVNLGVATK